MPMSAVARRVRAIWGSCCSGVATWMVQRLRTVAPTNGAWLTVRRSSVRC